MFDKHNVENGVSTKKITTNKIMLIIINIISIFVDIIQHFK